jgi:hypothetical protein
VSIAVAQAVLAAKKRLEVVQKKTKAREVDGEVDMELDSDAEAGSKASSEEDEDEEEEEEEEESIEDRIFFHRDGRSERRKVLQRGQAPANAIAWQASRTVLMEKLATNANAYLSIAKARFYEARDTGRRGKTPVLNGGELEAHFGEYDLDRVSLFTVLHVERELMLLLLRRPLPTALDGTSLSLLPPRHKRPTTPFTRRISPALRSNSPSARPKASRPRQVLLHL